MDKEKLQKVYNAMLRDGHISDAKANPFDKWLETWAQPERQGKLYDFLSENKYVTKPREEWIGSTFGGVQTPEKKNGASSEGSSLGSGTGSGATVDSPPDAFGNPTIDITDRSGDSPPEPPLAEDMERIFSRFKEIGDQSRVAAQQRTLEGVKERELQNPQPLTSRLLGHYTTRNRDQVSMANLQKDLIGTPAGADLEQRLKKIYDGVKPGDPRSLENAMLDAKELMLSKVKDKDVNVWDDLAENNARFSEYDPQGYHQRLNKQIVSRYSQAGMDEEAAYKKLMVETLENGVMDEDRTHEAKLMMTADELGKNLARLENQGVAKPQLDEARRQYNEALGAVKGMESERLSGLDTHIADLSRLLEMDSPPVPRSQIKENIAAAEAARAGFINPKAKIEAAYALHQGEADSALPQGTPLEKLKRLYAEKQWDRRQIIKRIKEAEGGNSLGGAGTELQNTFGGMIGQGHNADHRRLVQIESELKDLAPIVFLNESPAIRDDKAGLGPSTWNGLLSMMGGDGSPLSGTTRQQDALMLQRNLQIAGITPEVLNDPKMAGIADRTADPGLLDSEFIGHALGTSGGLMFHILTAQMLTKGAGMGKAIQTLVNAGNRTLKTGKYGGAALALLGDAVESGLTYHTAGMVNVDNKEELNLMSGFFGGMAGSLGKNGFNGAKKAIAGVFGDRASEAAKVIIDFGAQRIGSGVGESFEETGQQIVQLWQGSSTGQEFWEKMGRQFGDLPEAVKFYVSTFTMGAFMGGAHSDGLGKYLQDYAQQQVNSMSPEDRAVAEEIASEVVSESEALIEGAQSEEAVQQEMGESEREWLKQQEREFKEKIDKGNLSVEETAAVQQSIEAVRNRLSEIEGEAKGREQETADGGESQPAMELTPEAQAAQAELDKSRKAAEMLGTGAQGRTIEESLPEGMDLNEFMAGRMDEDITGLERRLENPDLTDAQRTAIEGEIEQKKNAKVGFQQMRDQTAFREVSPAPGVENTEVVAPVVEEGSESPVSPDESIIDVTGQGMPIPQEQKKSAEALLQTLAGLGVNLDLEDIGRVNNNEIPGKLYGADGQEINPGTDLHRQAMEAIQAHFRNNSQQQASQDPSIIDVTGQSMPIPPVEVGDTMEFDAPAPGGQTQKRSGKVLEVLPDGRYRVEVNIGGTPTEMVTPKPKEQAPASPAVPSQENAVPPVIPPVQENAPVNPPVIPPPTTETAPATASPQEQRERGLWRTFDRHRETNPGKVSEVLDRAREAAKTWYTRLKMKDEMAAAEKEIEDNGGYFEEYEELSSNSRLVTGEEIPRRRAKQLLSIRFFGDLADQLADEMENAETPEVRDQARTDLESAMERVEALSDIAAREGTAYGQANALNSQWRGLMENTAAYITNAIERHNREMAEGKADKPRSKEKARERKKKTRETRDSLNETRAEVTQDIEVSQSVDTAVDAVENETAKPKEKPAKKKKTGLGKTREQIAEMKRKALEDMQKAARDGFAGSLGSPAAFNFLEAAGRYGYALVAEGVITFKEWSAKMKQDIPAITDAQLQDVWDNQSVEGDTIANHARGEVEAAATPRKRTAAQKKTLRGKIRDAVKNHFKKDADPNVTLQERLMDEADLTAEEAQFVYEAVKDEVKARAEEKIRRRANALRRKKPKPRKHDPKSDIEKAVEAMVDGEFTDDMVRDIFADRLGFGPKLTTEQIAEMRRLGRALQEAPDGSRLEQMAAMELDRYASQFMPTGNALVEGWDLWKALVYASVLSGVPTHIKNILSSSSMMALVVADGFTNISKWTRAFRTAWKAKDGEKMQALARANPVTEMIVKIEAMVRALPKGFDAFMDIMKHGVLDSKYLERNQSKLGRLQSPLERRTFTGIFKPYNLMKYVGRLLAAEDAFMFTIAHEAELADAVRRSRLESAPGNIVTESRKALAENSQEWQDAMNQAGTEVAALQSTLNLSPREMDRATRRRAREILHEGMGLNEQMLQDAEDIAKSRIFTLKREGFWGKLATGMKMLNSAAKRKNLDFLWPFIMFTDIIGNIGDTMGDFSPFRGIARANGVSITGAIQSFGGMNQSARMSERTKEDGKSWWQTAFGSDKAQKYYEQMGRAWFGKVLFMAVMALMFGDDDDDRWLNFTGSDHPTNPNYIMVDGKPVMSWLLLPWAVPTLSFATKLDSQMKKNPNMSKEDLEGWGKRLSLAFLASETGVGGMSMAESANALLEFGSIAAKALAGKVTGDGDDFDNLGNLAKQFTKSVLGVVTKPLPQRITFIEQASQLLDPSVYSKRNFESMLQYAFTGAFFREPTMDVTRQIDIFGNEIKRNIGSDTFDYISRYQNDKETKKRMDFLYDHGVTFGPLQNRELFFEDGDDVVKEKMSDKEFETYARLSGKKFAEGLDAYMENRTIDGLVYVPEDSKWEDDYKTPQEKETDKTMLEKKVKAIMTKARDLAKKEMDTIPASEGGFKNKRL
jgi:hypothetical protein